MNQDVEQALAWGLNQDYRSVAGVLAREVERLRVENDVYKAKAEGNRISLLQYASLRKHFNALILAVLGTDYYNSGMDVYTCDAESCCDIAFKFSRLAGDRFKVARAALEKEAPHGSATP